MWSEILGHWPAIVFDFQAILHLDLTAEWTDARPWRWFVMLIQGLLSQQGSLLRAAIAEPVEDVDTAPTNDEEN